MNIQKTYEELLMENNMLKIQLKELEEQLKVKDTRNAGRKPISKDKIHSIYKLKKMGYKNNKIAKILNISEKTVKNYLMKKDNIKINDNADDFKLYNDTLVYIINSSINKEIKKDGKIPNTFNELKEYYKQVDNLDLIVNKVSPKYNNLNDFLKKNNIVLDLPMSSFFNRDYFN